MKISHKITDGIGDTFVTLIVAKYMELKDISILQQIIYNYNIEKDIRLDPGDIKNLLTTEYLSLLSRKNSDNAVDYKIVNGYDWNIILNCQNL